MAECPYILFCAGEDSGDILGESFVKDYVGRGFAVKGVGGYRMQRAGLQLLIPYESLPVSGFGDVVPHYFKLRRFLKILKKTLESECCKGLVAVDYPGFNMVLTALAKKYGKPVTYVAPPQVWAWKKGRVKKLRNVNLQVLFDFERQFFEKHGCSATLLEHPFKKALHNFDFSIKVSKEENPYILLLPGSRKKQALRNIDFYLNIAQEYISRSSQMGNIGIKILISRESLVLTFTQALKKYFKGSVPEWISVEMAAEATHRASLFYNAEYVITPPGSATLEVHWSQGNLIVSTITDKLTYLLGKLLVKTKYFALPNILLGFQKYPEFIFFKCSKTGCRQIVDYMDSH
ncbi:MAG: lipid-A-disaccharide synthase [Fibrobacteraceae bacterium]|nr:lipid-A-disaccharide synthase [Fibrobacteraceae bacterium]